MDSAGTKSTDLMQPGEERNNAIKLLTIATEFCNALDMAAHQNWINHSTSAYVADVIVASFQPLAKRVGGSMRIVKGSDLAKVERVLHEVFGGIMEEVARG